MELLLGLLAGLVAGLAAAWLVLRSRSSATLEARLAELGTRIAALEQHDQSLREGVHRLDTGLAQTSTAVQSLQQSTEAVRQQLARASEGLTALQELARAQGEADRRAAESLRRLEMVLAGTATKGVAGENVVEALFRQLPPEWQARGVQVEGKVVEFGLRLPNGLLVPIDSKWAATRLLEELAQAPDGETAQRLRNQLLQAVRARMEEVRKYLHPELTWGFAIVVVPDAVFELAAEAQVEGLRMNVVLLGYSSLVPYLLLVVQMAMQAGASLDLQKLGVALKQLRSSFEAIQEELDGRYSRALTMLQNGRDELRAHVQRALVGLATLETRSGSAGDAIPPPGP